MQVGRAGAGWKRNLHRKHVRRRTRSGRTSSGGPRGQERRRVGASHPTATSCSARSEELLCLTAAMSCSARPPIAPRRAAPPAASATTSCSALAEVPRHARQVPSRFGAPTGRRVTTGTEETRKLSRNAGARPILRAREEGVSVGRASTGALSADATHRPPQKWSCCRRERKMNWIRTMMPAAGWICGPCAT
jgi:hypothetical protein